MLHFVFITSYVVNKERGSKFSFYALAYVYPFFHQDWALFVPPPPSNYQLLVEDKNGCYDVYNDILTQHRYNRLAGKGHLLISFTNLIHYVDKAYPNPKSINGPIKNYRNFDMLVHAIKAYELHKNRDTNKLKITVVVRDIKLLSSRVYFN